MALCAVLAGSGGHAVAAADPVSPRLDPAAIVEHRQQALAYVAGLQAYFYGYPVVDYLRVMRDQITPDRDPGGVYAPVNQIAFQDNLAEPGGLYAGRGPNTSTLYFTAWMDLSDEPVLIEAPDTAGRYYVLTYADMYSEVEHSGRRTTGTGAQKILVVGPDWRGEAPEGVRVMPMRTRYAYLLGRVLVDGPDDLAAPPVTGWSTPGQETYGVYGHDYLRRAMVEFHGFLGNRAEETIYLSALTDAAGAPLVGSNRYEIVFPASGLPPANAFWALNAYDARTVDLIPNAQDRYAVTDRMPDLKRRADGSVVVRLQQTRPDAGDVNWLPVNDGPLFVTLRFFEPAPEVLAGDYSPPAIRPLP